MLSPFYSYLLILGDTVLRIFTYIYIISIHHVFTDIRYHHTPFTYIYIYVITILRICRDFWYHHTSDMYSYVVFPYTMKSWTILRGMGWEGFHLFQPVVMNYQGCRFWVQIPLITILPNLPAGLTGWSLILCRARLPCWPVRFITWATNRWGKSPTVFFFKVFFYFSYIICN